MYLHFERVASSSGVKTIHDLFPHAEATHVEIQADTQSVKYTMDGLTAPSSSSGMSFLTTDPPKTFLMDDLKNIKFTQGSGGAGGLNFHYFKG